MEPETPVDALLDLLMRARCLKPGEQPPELPKVEPDASDTEGNDSTAVP